MGHLGNQSRRGFMGALLGAVVTVPVGIVAFSQAGWAQAKKGKAMAKKLVGPKDPMAMALKYFGDVKDKGAVKVRTAARQGVAAKAQFCDNCALYVADGKIGKDMVGKCQMIPGGHVKAKGWCNSWIKKS